MALLVAMWLAGCTKDPAPMEQPAEPGELLVGTARTRMPVPLGIGTSGYGGFGLTADPTPFAEIYPGTTAIHNHPDFRAIVITRGEGFELVFLRVDMIGMFQHMRRAVVLELEARMGRNLDHALIIGATHTHSGPGRVLDAGGPFDLIADKFFPEFYERMVDALADTVEAAFADAAPGKVGIAWGYTDEGHDDRRCEDGQDYTNGALPVIAVSRDEEVKGLLLAYAIHGTVLGIEDLTLSQDVMGGIEQAVADRFDHDVVVASFNAWGADMSPASPVVPSQTGADQPDGYDRMEQVGVVIADAVDGAMAAMTFDETPDIGARTSRFALDREAIGYQDGVFPYPYGGIYCASPTPEDCDVNTTIDDLDKGCIPFNEVFAAPPQTEITAGHLGDLAFVTFPGEPGTLLAEQIMAQIREGGDVAGADNTLFIGYAQDYSGYSILEEDWWQGGYEASGALWGPRQGAYLADRAVDAYRFAHGATPGAEPAPVLPFEAKGYTPYAAPSPVDVGLIVGDVPTTATSTDVVMFTVNGDDPWFGAPIATVLRDDGTPVLRPNGTPVTSEGQAFWVSLETTPSYADNLGATTRAFHWSFHLPVAHQVVGAAPELTGTLRIEVAVPRANGATETVRSGPVSIVP